MLKTGDPGEAESHFHNALAIDAQFPPALHNSAAMALSRGQYKHAVDFARRAIATKNAVPTTVLLFGEAALAAHKADDPNAPALMAEAVQNLQASLTSTYDYSTEIKILMGYLNLLRNPNGQERALQSSSQIADEDPSLTSDHIHDLRFYHDRAGSKAAFQWLRDYGQILPTVSPRLKGLLGFLQFRGHEKQEGKQMVVDAVEQSPDGSSPFSN